MSNGYSSKTDDFKEALEPSSTSSRGGYRVRYRENFNYKEYHKWMNTQLSQRITSLAVALLGNPSYRRPMEWRYGEKHHFLINVSGDRQGWWHNFESGESGDALQLVKNYTGYKGKDLSNWVKSFIGHSYHKTQSKAAEEWKPVLPVPFEVTGSKYYEHLLRDFSERGLHQTMRHAYRDWEGNLMGYVVRLEGNGRKMTLPMTYCSNAKGSLS